jgi:hypothetical protein
MIGVSCVRAVVVAFVAFYVPVLGDVQQGNWRFRKIGII